MAAARYDFINAANCSGSPLEVGATFSYQLVWQKEQPADSQIFVPVDLTGYSAKMQVRKAPGSPVILELSNTNTFITFDALNGVINLLVPASITANLAAGIYKYDLDLTDAGGFVTRFIYGNFEIVGTITV